MTELASYFEGRLMIGLSLRGSFCGGEMKKFIDKAIRTKERNGGTISVR